MPDPLLDVYQNYPSARELWKALEKRVFTKDATRRLSRHTNSLGKEHWDVVNRVFKYLNKTMDYGLKYNEDPSVLEGYTYASWITDQEDYVHLSECESDAASYELKGLALKHSEKPRYRPKASFNGSAQISWRNPKKLWTVELIDKLVLGKLEDKGNLNNLEEVSLAKNSLTGPINGELEGCLKLRSLNLRSNEIEGVIRVQISKLDKLENLDLSENSLVGKLPPQFGDLKVVQTLNLSYNQLEGPLLRMRAFKEVPMEALQNNKHLCGNGTGNTSSKYCKALWTLFTFTTSFLVYEFLAGGSLRKVLNDMEHAIVFDWKKRVIAVKGIAKALSYIYMHHDCSQPIIHRDRSSRKVLLDSDWVAHVSDFGTARLLKPDFQLDFICWNVWLHRSRTCITMEVTEKCDVYSFGLLTLEIIMEKHPGDFLTPSHDMNFESLTEVMDQHLPPPVQQIVEQVKLLVEIAIFMPETKPSL
nr:MDIS1-interacting receptor like kinase 2-like [Tanacetum cinerariifolium]